MATTVLTYGYVAINGSDLSAYCKKIELSMEVEELDSTTFSSTGWKSTVGGLKSASLSLTFNQDVANSALDSILSALTFGNSYTFEVRASGASVGTSNPKWTGSIVLTQLVPLSGDVGQIAEIDVTWPVTGAVTRATS